MLSPEQIASGLAGLYGTMPVRWRAINVDRRGNPVGLAGPGSSPELTPALLYDTGDNPGLEGGRLDLDNARGTVLEGALTLRLDRLPGGVASIDHIALREVRTIQPPGGGTGYFTASEYLAALNPSAYYRLGEATGDAIDLIAGNDGTVVYAEGQRAQPPLDAGGDGSIRFEEGTTNLVSNPSFETGITGWGAVSPGNDTMTQETDEAAVGDASAEITCAGVTSFEGRGISFTTVISTAYTGSLHVKAPVGAALRLRLVDQGSGTVLVTTSFVGTGAWQRVICTAAATGTTTNLQILKNGGAAQVVAFRIDAAQAEAKARATSYCDGSLGTGHAWTGTPHASTSTRVATLVQVTDDDAIQDVFDGGGFAACLFRAFTLDNNTRVLMSKEGTGATDGGWMLYARFVSGGLCRLIFRQMFDGGGSPGRREWRSGFILAADTDYGVGVSYNADSDANTPTIYLANLGTGAIDVLTVGDGLELDPSFPTTGTRLSDATYPLKIGDYQAGVQTFNGLIDEVTLWQTPPTPEQIDEWIELVQQRRAILVPPPPPEDVEFPRGIYKPGFSDITYHWLRAVDGNGLPTEVVALFPTVAVRLHDLSYWLLSSDLGDAVNIPAGTDYYDILRDICDALGLRHDFPAAGGPVTPVVAARPSTWSYAELARDVTDGRNLYPVYMDLIGIMRTRERVDPAIAPIAEHYRVDQEPRMIDSADAYVRSLDVPDFDNHRVVQITDPDHPDRGYVRYVNADPSSPISTVATGQVRNRDVISADSRPSTRLMLDDATARDVARFELRRLAAEARRASLSTLPDPRRGPHETYLVTIPGASDGVRHRVLGWSQQLRPGAPMQHRLAIAEPVAITEYVEP